MLSEEAKLPYDYAEHKVVGCLALSITYDWADAGDRQKSIETLWGSCEEEAYLDGRVYRSWEGPTCSMTYEEYLQIEQQYPNLYDHLQLIEERSRPSVITGYPNPGNESD